MTHFTNTDDPIDFPVSQLKHTTGNLLDLAEAGEFDIIIQGCNCFNTMGGGLAKEIRERYPHVAEVDLMTLRGDYTKLGNWTTSAVVKGDNAFVVINAYTQYEMSKGEDVFEYAAFDLILQKLSYMYGNKRFGLPYIGMGLAGGDADVIMNQIDFFAETVAAQGGSVTLVEFG